MIPEHDFHSSLLFDLPLSNSVLARDPDFPLGVAEEQKMLTRQMPPLPCGCTKVPTGQGLGRHNHGWVITGECKQSSAALKAYVFLGTLGTR